MELETIIKYVSLLVSASALIYSFVVAIMATRLPPRLLSQETVKSNTEGILKARAEALERMSHFERLMVAIGTIQFGILAYVGGRIANQNVPEGEATVLFILINILFFIVTVAYLHIWKVYMGYSIYTAQLEIHALDHDLRITAKVFGLAQDPQVPCWTKLLVKAASSLQIVSMFPVFILTVAIVGFGIKFDIPWQAICAIAMMVLAWTILYVSPSIIEFANLVDKSTRTP